MQHNRTGGEQAVEVTRLLGNLKSLSVADRDALLRRAAELATQCCAKIARELGVGIDTQEDCAAETTLRMISKLKQWQSAFTNSVNNLASNTGNQALDASDKVKVIPNTSSGLHGFIYNVARGVMVDFFRKYDSQERLRIIRSHEATHSIDDEKDTTDVIRTYLNAAGPDDAELRELFLLLQLLPNQVEVRQKLQITDHEFRSRLKRLRQNLRQWIQDDRPQTTASSHCGLTTFVLPALKDCLES